MAHYLRRTLYSGEGKFESTPYPHFGKYIDIFYDRIDHKVWLGTSNKITQIDPILLRQEIQQSQKVKITDIEINSNEELSYTDRQSKHIRLTAKQNNLRISFSDYQYKGESLTNYAFKLDGYHSQWIELNRNENSITLPNLSPGDYTLYIGSLETSQIISRQKLFCTSPSHHLGIFLGMPISFTSW